MRNEEVVKPNPVSLELVRKFVTAAHGDYEEVKKLVEHEPALVNAVMNWGGDDWESGLGAAAHLGNRPIAEFLLERGARLDIFSAAMLGDLELVKSMLKYYRNTLDIRGPHGIPLMRHAQMGGEQAEHVVDYLKTLLSKEEVS